MRHTKIIATIGPATNSDATIGQLMAAGVDVFRLNFSHGSHEDHADLARRIREASERHGRTVALLQDLSGPKIRTGRLRDGTALDLRAGDSLSIAVGDFVGGPGRVSTTYAELPVAVRRGDTLLLDDGHIALRVEESSATEIRTTVVDGGPLGERKGINAPGVTLPASGLTAKDIEDLKFGLTIGIDFVGMSFVQRGADIRQARDIMRQAGAQLPVVAKLERPEAVSRLEEILEEADAVMVARGDLGLELPLEHVPRVQKEITRQARAVGVPVVVATQVLESMRTEPRPTRAEVSDAANAVDDGVDAIMLAGETAVGAYPVRAVETLDRIIRDAETQSPPEVRVHGSHVLGGHGRAIGEASVRLAEKSDALAIVAVTRGGKTARLLSALRPRAPIYGATDRVDVSRNLAFSWGVVPVLTDVGGDVNEAASRIGTMLVERGDIPPSSVIVLVSITPDLAPGPSNFLKLQRV